MHLLNTTTYELRDFAPSSIPEYAILSHVWNADEISFQDVSERLEEVMTRKEFAKIAGCSAQARLDGYQWIWIDTCCIDKKSSAELHEAINSMFAWYENSAVCYAYLEDVKIDATVLLSKNKLLAQQELRKSRWFTRGWTLQELIAPKENVFFNKYWSMIGSKNSDFRALLIQISGVTSVVLGNSKNLAAASVAERMSWASQRLTTRPEDRAYSLMGLFGVHMPIIYGEGLQKAFKRLQIEILMLLPDQTIFAWRSKTPRTSGLLASSPIEFKDCNFRPIHLVSHLRPFSITNMGTSINLPLTRAMDEKYGKVEIATLSCSADTKSKGGVGQVQQVQIVLKRFFNGKDNMHVYQRVHTDTVQLTEMALHIKVPKTFEILVLEDDQARWLVHNPVVSKRVRTSSWSIPLWTNLRDN
jgi:hypothetical protein